MARFRTLIKNWKLAAIAVFSLSVAMALAVVGIGVSNYVLLRPLAAADPGRLVTIYQRSAETAVEGISYPAYKYYRDQSRSFLGVAAYPTLLSKSWLEDRGELLAEAVSDNYFSVMGMQPVLGRFFSPGDDEKRSAEAVLTYAAWKRWGADPNIIGTSLKLNTGVTIIGVAPKEFTGALIGLSADVIVLLSSPQVNQEQLASRDVRNLTVIARLKTGVSRKQALAEMHTLSQNLGVAYPQTDKGRVPVMTRATVVPVDAQKDADLIAGVLMFLALSVVLVACANVANLLLALAVKRRQETLIKAAIGATRRRLIGEFLIESAALCTIGGALGYLIGAAVLNRISVFSTLLPLIGNISISAQVTPDLMVAVLCAALVLMATLATGVPAALFASSPNLAPALSGETPIGGRRKSRIRNSFVVIQVSVCTIVLVGLGLCLQSVNNLRNVDPGFSARNIADLMVVDVQQGNHSEVQEDQIQRSFAETVSQVPGVEAVSLTNGLPIAGGFSTSEVQISGQAKPIQIQGAVVDDKYFSTMGIPVYGGRVFDSSDRAKGPESVVINQKLAQDFWPNQDPIGKTLRIGKPAHEATVVGIVKNGKYNDLDEPTNPFLYFALSQHHQNEIQVVVRTKGDPRLWVEPLTRTVRAAGLVLPVPPFTMDGLLYLDMLVPMLTLYIVGGLSALGVLLAMAGLFGAISYSIGERRRELGIRAALGALPSDLLGMVMREITTTVGVGILAGAGIGAAATVVVRSQLFGIQGVEWTVLLPVILSMGALAAMIAYAAARPWIKADPLEPLRHA